MTATKEINKVAGYLPMEQAAIFEKTYAAVKDGFSKSEIQMYNDLQVLLDDLKKEKYSTVVTAEYKHGTKEHKVYMKLLIYAKTTGIEVLEIITLRKLELPSVWNGVIEDILTPPSTMKKVGCYIEYDSSDRLIELSEIAKSNNHELCVEVDYEKFITDIEKGEYDKIFAKLVDKKHKDYNKWLKIIKVALKSEVNVTDIVSGHDLTIIREFIEDSHD